MTAAVGVEAAVGTHVGHVRLRNEDAAYRGRRLFVVADGLGGHVAGDVASRTAVDAVAPYDRLVPPEGLADVLGGAISAADDALRRRVRAEPALAGMGTTMVALLVSGAVAVVANIGDSRAYLVGDREDRTSPLVRLSEDHTYRYLVAHADLVPSLPDKLTRFLDGRRDGRSPDLIPLRLRPGMRILLCSDGLSSYVAAETIRHTLLAGGTAARAAGELVASALDQGGRDNVTAMVIDAISPMRRAQSTETHRVEPDATRSHVDHID